MKGSLIKRSPCSWSAVIELGRDPITGKRRQKWYTVAGNKKDAQRELTRLLHSLDTGCYVDPTKLTVRDYLEKWLADYAKTNVGAKTFHRYQEIVRLHLVPALGAYPLNKLQPLNIQSYYTHALEAGRLPKGPKNPPEEKRGLSEQTVLHHHRVLHDALHRAVRWQLLVTNPVDRVEPPRPRRKEVNAPDESQAARLLAMAEGTPLYIPAVLAVCTGARRGEILAIRWSDLDLETGVLMVRRSLQQTPEGLSFKEPKNGRVRRIDLPALAVEALKLHRGEERKQKELLGESYQDLDLVCCHEDGSLWRPESFSPAFSKFARLIGLKSLRYHDLRHGHASQLLKAGIHVKAISERLGHATCAFTLDVYGHLLPGIQQEAARKVDAALRYALEKERPTVA